MLEETSRRILSAMANTAGYSLALALAMCACAMTVERCGSSSGLTKGRFFEGMFVDHNTTLAQRNAPTVHGCRHLCSVTRDCTAISYNTTSPTRGLGNCRLFSLLNISSHLANDPASQVIVLIQVLPLIGKVCAQSSELSPVYHCGNAIDGNRMANHPDAIGCTHTSESEAFPWWQVEMGKQVTVVSVEVLNRADSCCSYRLDSISVLVGDAKVATQQNSATCVSNVGYEAIPIMQYRCASPLRGRFVTIMKNSTNPVLTLCEVEVYGI